MAFLPLSVPSVHDLTINYLGLNYSVELYVTLELKFMKLELLIIHEVLLCHFESVTSGLAVAPGNSKGKCHIFCKS